MYEVPINLKSKLMMPLLSYKAKAVINRLSVDELDDYEVVSIYLLTQFRLTPREYRARFQTATKSNCNDDIYII